MNLSQIREYLIKKNGVLEELGTKISKSQDSLSQLLTQQKIQDKAVSIIREAANDSQVVFLENLSIFVSEGLKTIFDKSYRYEIRVVQRGKVNSITQILHTDQGNFIDPINSVGGGVNYILSFLLCVASLILKNKENRVLVMDEPFRFVSKDLLPKVAEMLKFLTDSYNIQFIIVTHEQELLSNLEAENIIRIGLDDIEGNS